MNIVFVSHSAFHPSLVVGSHQLSRVYAKAGHRVLHLSLPFSIAHVTRLGKPQMMPRLKKALNGPIEIEPNLFEWVPLSLLPWDAAKHLLRPMKVNLTVPLARRITSTLRQLKISPVDLALIDDSRMVGIERILRASKSVYRATDLYAQYRGDSLIIEAEKKLILNMDAVFATSEKVAEHLRQLSGREVDVFSNGFDAEHFASRKPLNSSLEAIASPRAVYVGAVDHRFDLESVIGMARQMPSLQVLIYGPVTIEVSPTLPANLRLMGSLDYQSLPAVLQHCDIALLPLCDIPENHGRSPMKYYEYRASGLPIAAMAVQSMRSIDSDRLYLYAEPTAEGLADAVTRALEASSHKGGIELSESELSQSWQRIGDRILDRVADTRRPM